MTEPIDQHALDVMFRQARTHALWRDEPVSDETLREIYDLAKLGPTSANTLPLRILFVKSAAAKERLRPALNSGNVEKTMKAPVCAIMAYDLRFYEFIPKISPSFTKMIEMFSNPENAEKTKIHAFRNATLQGAYFLIAARALGLDVGPMSGFDNAKVDAEFFPDGRWKSNFLMNLGYGTGENLHPRNPRLEFDEACRIV